MLLCFAGTAVLAQLHYKGRNLTITDGLSDNRVTCFYKDRSGFLWVGTKNGLNRYDGHSFKIFRPAKENSISNEVINDIAGDSEGRIWVATMGGLNCYDPADNSWNVLLPGARKTKNEIPNLLIWDIWFDNKGLLWIASDVFEFTSYDTKNKKFTYYDWPGFAREKLQFANAGNYNSIQKFVAKGEQEFLLGTSKGLVSLQTETGEFTFLGGKYYADVYDIKYDPGSRRVFLSVQNGQVFSYDEQTKDYVELKQEVEAYPSIEFKSLSQTESWMASEKGLLKIDPVKNKAILSSPTLPFPGALLPGGVTSIMTDETGIRWIATPNGITSIDYSHLYSYFLPLVLSSGKEGINYLTGVYFDAEEDKYFVCSANPASVFIISRKTGQIERITKDQSGAALPACFTVKKDAGNRLWLLTERNVYLYDRKGRSFSLFPLPNKGEVAGFRDVIQDAEGNLWFAGFQAGIYYYNTAAKKCIDIPDSLGKYLNRLGTCLYSDSINKEVWIGTMGANLYKYDLVAKKMVSYYETEQTRDYASLNLINDITADQNGTIWLATHTGGVFRYNRGQSYTKAFTKFDMRTGLESNNFISLAADQKNNLWLLSGNGISVMDTAGRPLSSFTNERTFTFSSYGSDVNIPHDIFYDKARKELVLAAAGGVLFYYPYPEQNTITFPLILTEVVVEGAQQNLKPLHTGSALRIPSGTRSLQLQFAGLYFGGSDEILYEYRLKGHDTGWIRTDNNFRISYQNLPAGTYTFQARAVDRFGRIAGELKEIPVSVSPAFWQTGWFLVLCILAVLAAVVGIIHSLQQKLKEEEQLNSFATSLYGQSTVDDIFWDIANNCIRIFGFEDCVIYQRDEYREVMIQRAAAGPKNPYQGRDIVNLLEIPIGDGIVGTVAKTSIPELIRNTKRDTRYIVDDERRLSEITVPVMIDGKVYAIIDSEHHRKNYFKKYHLRMLLKIAAISAERISKYLTEERLRTKIARDLHDEMGSTLTSINILSKVGMESGQVSEELRSYLQKIKDNSGKMMESMSDIVWAINPANDSLEKVLIRMKEFAAEMLEPARINYYFDTEGSLDQSLLNLEQRKDLYMIFKEAINNAVKYSAATEINITLQQHDQRLRLTVTDNGKGFDTASAYAGNGLKNMQSRAAAMQAELRITSILGAGTTVLLEKQVT